MSKKGIFFAAVLIQQIKNVRLHFGTVEDVRKCVLDKSVSISEAVLVVLISIHHVDMILSMVAPRVDAI